MAKDKGDRTALVTGAGRRLGRIIALDLPARGWCLGVHYRAAATEAAALVVEIERNGGKAAAFAAGPDRRRPGRQRIAGCAAGIGAPACLSNSAAGFERDTLATLDGPTWQAHLDVKLRAPIFRTHAFASALPEGMEGNVINIRDQKVLRL